MRRSRTVAPTSAEFVSRLYHQLSMFLINMYRYYRFFSLCGTKSSIVKPFSGLQWDGIERRAWREPLQLKIDENWLSFGRQSFGPSRSCACIDPGRFRAPGLPIQNPWHHIASRQDPWPKKRHKKGRASWWNATDGGQLARTFGPMACQKTCQNARAKHLELGNCPEEIGDLSVSWLMFFLGTYKNSCYPNLELIKIYVFFLHPAIEKSKSQVEPTAQI